MYTIDGNSDQFHAHWRTLRYKYRRNSIICKSTQNIVTKTTVKNAILHLTRPKYRRRLANVHCTN